MLIYSYSQPCPHTTQQCHSFECCCCFRAMYFILYLQCVMQTCILRMALNSCHVSLAWHACLMSSAGQLSAPYKRMQATSPCSRPQRLTVFEIILHCQLWLVASLFFQASDELWPSFPRNFDTFWTSHATSSYSVYTNYISQVIGGIACGLCVRQIGGEHFRLIAARQATS